MVWFVSLVGCGQTCERAWHPDLDGDGFGAERTRLACERPEGFVARAGDCDDADGAVNPDAADLCDGVDDDCDGTVDGETFTWFADGDGDGLGDDRVTLEACAAPDGFVGAGGDCDDGRADTHPGGDETCDGVDQDCDGSIDEGARGATWWYPDDDGDRFGERARRERPCSGPEGWTTRDGDCDDGDPDVSPAAAERCNGVDDDCDERIDEEDSDLVDALLMVPDLDRDGHGDPGGAPVWACGPTEGLSVTLDDCDDGEAGVFPGAVETCNARDDDCDRLVDDADPDRDPASARTGFADLDGDGLGDPLAPDRRCAFADGFVANSSDCDDHDRGVGPDWWVADLDGDGVGAGPAVAGVGCVPPDGLVNAALVDCDDRLPARSPRRPDRCGDGFDADCSGLDPACPPDLTGLVAPEDLARASLPEGEVLAAAAGDLDGDGQPDVAVLTADGALVLHYGPAPELAGVWADERRTIDRAAGPLLVVDADADGVDEIWLGDPDGARIAVVTGLRNGPTDTVVISGAGQLGLQLGHVADELGEGLLATSFTDVRRFRFTDLDPRAGDDADDVWTIAGGDLSEAVLAGGQDALGLVSAFAIARPTEFADQGRVWVRDPHLPGAIEDAELVVTGSASVRLGSALAFSDLDGDGERELVASAPGADGGGLDAGAVFAWSETGDLGLTEAHLRVDGVGPGAAIGDALLGGDADGDGADDLWIGASASDIAGPSSGAVHVFFGPLTGAHDALEADLVIHGVAGEGLGSRLGEGDVDGDGLTDRLLPGTEVWWLPSW